CSARGYFERAAHPPDWASTEGVARWDGDAWQPLAGGLRGWVCEMTIWNDRLVVGGPILSSPDAGYSSVLVWDGDAWSGVGGRIDGYVTGLTSWGNALVVARQLGSVEQQQPPLAISWGGGSWEYFGSDLIADHGSISDVAAFDGDLVVLGGALTVPGAPAQGVAAKDGQGWRTLANAPTIPFECALARTDGLWMGGRQPYVGPTSSCVWRWDGVACSPIGDLGGSVARLAETPGGVYAAGSLLVD